MTTVSAFYPYKEASNPEEDSANTLLQANNVQEHVKGQTTTIDIKKRRTKWNKRDKQYLVNTASAPAIPDSMGIHQDGQDYSYFSSIKVGSEGKEMWMLIDSGSANTWVFGAECTAQACSKHDTFGPNDSDTLNITSREWSVTYGTGKVGGVVASDTFAFAGYEVEIGFGLASNASNDFSTYPMDGILGLGRDSSNRLGTPTLMDIMASQRLLKANLFGVHLFRNGDGANDGQITFGAPDSSKFSGKLSYIDSVATDGLWEIPSDGAGVDGQSLGLTGKTAIIDTGTSYILMPLKDAQALHAKLPGSENNGEAFTIPCDTNLPVQFTFSGVTYDVSPKDYVGKPVKAGKMCASNIVGQQSFGPDTWLLGDVFLKNVYTVFDFDKDRIGFGIKSAAAAAAPSSSSTSPTATASGKVNAVSSSETSQAAVMGSTSGGSGSPREGKATAWSASPLPVICLTVLLAMSMI
ncbi:hypothetical protein GJ744_002987 [Endocarpon pusillum]|uniref:Peptidase A1 domain-containing protein n=1 Tax=Endocarpon pusillum TaxID=364733 RepID=A0A8H7AB77_9EURO|nr:hypothetical protein GJ744_002987 [Endocarpon pusillum]